MEVSHTTAKRKAICWRLGTAVILIAALVFWCEVFVFYVTLWKNCKWPAFDNASIEHAKVMLISDTHLLGERKGHWFDKLRREWQMYISYRAAISMFRPEYVFMLGDILDEGQIASDQQFEVYVETFKRIFDVDEDVKRVVVVGNHDIGFHDRVLYFDPYLRGRFENAFNTSLVDIIQIKGSHFITVNSMALQRDGCHLCNRAIEEIKSFGRQLSSCRKTATCSRPILLMHFPLYRKSDENCNEIDSDKSENKKVKFKPTVDCVSAESTKFILEQLKPRLIFTGHTHFGCLVKHTDEQIEEWTLASFSWRNIASPSFILARISKETYRINKCLLPNEIAVISTYVVTLLTLLLYTVFKCKKHL
ncbi:metallophosphoesterase 1-like isoform X1 [Leptotrombidium deliense]|uniref:Metallophosphoesterase 1-like isoform X1 n=1 Tax=Leptotrombidium deliense TaxID=299467 RepID=A0A443SLX1_9ACAR|nr:metallophosphoesterase 1-like isoform X1 [Leptotrombidium deliense]